MFLLGKNQVPPSSAWGLPAGWLSVADKGALGDGLIDDSAAFLSARDTDATVIYIPPGTVAAPKNYLISSTIQPRAGQTFYMPQTPFINARPGWSYYSPYYSQASILFVGTTNYCFNLNKAGASVEGVLVKQHPSYVPTAGGHFNTGDNATRAWGTSMVRCMSDSGWTGFSATQLCNDSKLFQCQSFTAVKAGFMIDLPIPSGDLHWDNLIDRQSTIGMYIRQCDTSNISNIALKGDGSTTGRNALWIAGDTGIVDQLSFETISIEDVLGDIRIGDGAYTVEQVHIHDMHCYQGGALYNLNLGNKCADVSISKLRAEGWRYIEAGIGSRLEDFCLHHYGSRQSGVGVDLRGTNQIITGGTIKDYTTALNLAANANYATINGNNFNRNNGAAATMDATAKATGRGTANIGLADW